MNDKFKRITSKSRETLVKNMIDVFRKNGVLSNICIVYNNKLVEFGDSDIIMSDDAEDIKFTEPSQTIVEGKNPSDWNGNDVTLVVLYDGGPLYSCMTGEYGWDWKSKLDADLEIVFGKFHLAIELIDNTSFTLIEGVTPDYELVMNKLCEWIYKNYLHF